MSVPSRLADRVPPACVYQDAFHVLAAGAPRCAHGAGVSAIDRARAADPGPACRSEPDLARSWLAEGRPTSALVGGNERDRPRGREGRFEQVRARDAVHVPRDRQAEDVENGRGDIDDGSEVRATGSDRTAV